MSEFFAMGGYAAFVWSAYAVAMVVLCGLLGISFKSMREREALVEVLRTQRGRRSAGGVTSEEQVS